MARLMTIIVATVYWACPAMAQTDLTTEERVDKIFKRWTQPGSPGMAVGVYHKGEIVLAKGYGLAHLEHDLPITPDSVFYLGSVSKQFVATAILLLVEDGKLSLDDDIRKHIPELPEYGHRVTVDHLVHHTSGYRDYLGLLQLSGRQVDHYHDDAGIIAMLQRQKNLNFVPGTKYAYSNSGYFLLNVIVERVSGKSLRKFAAERIFEPLEMEATHFHDDYQHIIPNRAMGYFRGSRRTYKQFMNTFDRVGSGGVYSSVRDLFLWDQNFEKRTVGGDRLNEAQHRRGQLNSGEQLNYAAGLVHGNHRGLKTVEHGGALGGYRSVLLRFPDKRFSVAILANLSTVNPGQLARRVADLYLDGAYPPEAKTAASKSEPDLIEPDVAKLQSLVGQYWNREEGLLREIKLTGDKLFYVRIPGRRSEIAPTGDRQFLMLGVDAHVPIVFTDDVMTVTAPGEGSLVYNKYEPQNISEKQLEPLAGAYFSAELDCTFTLSSASNSLLLQTPDRRIPLRPITDDVFALPQGRIVLEFQRNEIGQVKGFLFDAGSMRGFVFNRKAGN